MARRVQRPQGTTRRCAAALPLAALGVAACLAVRALWSPASRAEGSDAADAFVVGGAAGASLRGRVARYAEAAKAPSPSTSYALVKVTEENKMTTASVLGGVAGLLVGGIWVGGALFAATAYLTRKEDTDVAKALKGVASGGLEVLNFGAYLNDKYLVTDKIGASLAEAAASAKTTSTNKETLATAESFLQNVGDAITALDRDVGIKDTLGSLATSASELASQAVDGAIDINNKYKITDKIKDVIQEAVNKAQTK